MLGGACVGFLPHNFYPARMFMGDSGSMLIGLVLSGERDHADRAVLRHRAEQGRDGLTGEPGADLPARWRCRSPLLVVPIADLVLAVVRRTRPGASPFAPDKQHLHHRLLEIGHSQRRAVLIMWMWAALVAGRHGRDQPLHGAA